MRAWRRATCWRAFSRFFDPFLQRERCRWYRLSLLRLARNAFEFLIGGRPSEQTAREEMPRSTPIGLPVAGITRGTDSSTSTLTYHLPARSETVAERILHNPLGDALEPREVRVFSSGQFLLEINRRDGFPAFCVDLLLASKTIIVGKASRPCTLAEQNMLFHCGIKFRLVSSRDFHSYSSFSHSKYCCHASGVIVLLKYAKSFFS
jgi:hypothetical protein